MLARTAMRVAARRVAAQRRFTSAQPEALTKGEFRHYDTSEPYKYCADVSGFSTWGLFFFALQLQFLIVFGEGEPEFKVVDAWRNVLEG